MSNNFYITTTLPYVNADPHIGFALEIVQADAIARYKNLQGNEVFFNTGTDEHGLKIYRKAKENNKDPQDYVDEYAARFDNLKNALNLSYNNFIRTTDEKHKKAAQEFWKRCSDNGDIYKAKYEIKYCVGCELEKTDSELVDRKCPLHPTYELEVYEEENYFFKFSNLQERLLKLYDERPDFVVPENRQKEIANFVRTGLNDFSISRLKEKLPWGIPVPGDEDHVMYVWFDALVNYVSAIGWPEEMDKFEKWWPVLQIAGKDNLRQQSAMWQAMLLSAGLPPSEKILIHGFIGYGGQRMSKSLGNVVNPIDLSEKYGADAVRYYLLAKMHPFEDSDFTIEKFEQVYQGDLANGVGNLVSRVAGLADKLSNGKVPEIIKDPHEHPLFAGGLYSWKKAWGEIDKNMNEYRFDKALESIWKFISVADKYIDETKPWSLGDQKEIDWIIYGLCDATAQLAWQIAPFLPETCGVIAGAFGIEKLLTENRNYEDSWANIKPGTKVQLSEPLFPRLD